MNKNIKGTFTSLNPKAKLFEAIRIQQPQWWIQLCNDNELYVEIRKDNYINVYYYGGSLAKINYLNGFVAKTHQKYLGDTNSRRKTKNGKDVFSYDQIDLCTLDKSIISEIKTRIKNDYVRQINAEKWIQGKMIKGNHNYIDSEFQFNQDPEIGKLRIDLVELSDDTLSFVELKGIFDNRLRNDINRNSKIPEIIEQMEKYKLFINKYEANIIEYYQKLIEIKNTLGLTVIDKSKIHLNKTPKLIIVDTYSKMTSKREERIVDIKSLLGKYKVDFEITK